MPFGIPTIDEAASLLEGAAQDNVTDLTQVASQAIQSIGQPLLASRADLNTIQGRLRTKLGHAVRWNDKSLDGIGNIVDVQLGNAIVNNLTDMPGLAAASPAPIGDSSVTMTPGTQLPPAPTMPIDVTGLTGPEKLALKLGVLGQAPAGTIPAQQAPAAGIYWYANAADGIPGNVGTCFFSTDHILSPLEMSQMSALLTERWGMNRGVVGPFPAGWTPTAVQQCIGEPVPPEGAPPPIPPPPPPIPPIVDVPPQGVSCAPSLGDSPSPPAPPTGAPCLGIIPAIGSKEFCDALPTIKEGMHQLGEWLIENYLNSIVPDFHTDLIDTSSIGGVIQTLNPIVLGFKSVVNYAADSGAKWADDFKAKITSLRDNLSCISSCDGPALFSVAVVKMILSILKHVRLGTDLGLWATADAAFDPPQLERVIDYVMNYICPSEIPGIGETIEAYNRGQITKDQYYCWMMMRGADWNTWEPIRKSRVERLVPREAIEMTRRLGEDSKYADEYLKKLGYYNTDDRTAIQTLYDQLPTIGDHLHWLARNVFNTEYVQRYHLLDGFAADDTIRNIKGFETYTTLAAPQRGLFWTEFGPDLYAQGMKIDYAARHYAAHWIMPSPEQMKQFVYRLRPGRVAPGHEFTAADMERILQEQDYNVLARQWFVDTVNPVPAISYVKRMFQLGAIDAAQLKAYHMDLGYTEIDAANFVAVDTIDKARHLATSGHGWTPQAMANAYAIGQVTEAQVRSEMDLQGYPKRIQDQLLARSTAEFDRLVLTRARSRALYQMATTVKSAITAGTMSVDNGADALVNMGWPVEYAQSMTTLADVAARAGLSKAGVARIRSAYRGGEETIDDAANRLIALGIVPNRVQQLITLWQIENTPNRKRRTAQQIVADVSQGHMSVEEALVRLTNLGYEDADRQLFLADIQGKVAKMASTKNAANIKAGKQQAAELARLARQAQNTRSAALRRLKMLEPVTKLQKWLKLGIIDEQYFDGRMRLYGYSDGEIAAYKAEIVPKKG